MLAAVAVLSDIHGVLPVTAAVRGVRLAIGSAERPRFGVALYADFAATEADWDAYRTDWLGR